MVPNPIPTFCASKSKTKNFKSFHEMVLIEIALIASRQYQCNPCCTTAPARNISNLIRSNGQASVWRGPLLYRCVAKFETRLLVVKWPPCSVSTAVDCRVARLFPMLIIHWSSCTRRDHSHRDAVSASAATTCSQLRASTTRLRAYLSNAEDCAAS